jgi:hypothetical protein
VDNTNSETFIVLNFEKKLAIVGNTEYAGELKKSVFTLLNYLLPLEGVLSMHCSANVNPEDTNDVALFFGLSGTGKTTLSADPTRRLIGDDEHGWSDNGVFNFEGGCYAKVIGLSESAEPEIYATTKMFGTILENVPFDPITRLIDLDDDTITENTRASYPLEFIANAVPEKKAGHPKNVILLTCDASGVMPPIARLTPNQALYQFISGYTSKIAGTEVGLRDEPAAVVPPLRNRNVRDLDTILVRLEPHIVANPNLWHENPDFARNVLPHALHAIQQIAAWSRYMRSSMLEVLQQDYVRTARAKGLPGSKVLYKHALKNALLPVITLLGLSLPSLLAGAAITESIFSWPGLGYLAVQSVTTNDFPTILAIVMMGGMMVLLGNLLADVLYGFVDPRIKY